MTDKLLTIKDVLAKLQISRKTWYNINQKHKISTVKIGRSVRYKESEINRFVESQKVEPATA